MQTWRLQLWDDVKKVTSSCLLFAATCLLPSTALAGPPPVIIAQPLDVNVALGGTATFEVKVNSGTAVTYQWFKDEALDVDVVLVGQTSSALTISNVGLADFSAYYVVVRNAGGAVTSRSARLGLLALNSPPVGQPDYFSTQDGGPLLVPAPGVLANDADAENNTLSAVLVDNVTHGSLTLDPSGQFVYVPDANYSGSDSFTYMPHDGLAAGGFVTVTINVTPLNQPPVAESDFVTLPEDGEMNVRVLDNDYDPEGASLTVVAAFTTNGTAVVNNSGSGGRVRFTPEENFHGTVVFNYTVTDGTVSAIGTVTVTVTPVNDAPVSSDDTYTGLKGKTIFVPVSGVLYDGTPGVGVLANDLDVDGDALTAQLVSPVSNGTLVLNPDGSFVYTPNPGFSGADSFTYSATDGSDAGNVATVTIHVAPVSAPPTITAQRMAPEGFQLEISSSASATCVIFASSNLQDWTPICTNAVTAGTFTFTDIDSRNHDARFYRIESR